MKIILLCLFALPSFSSLKNRSEYLKARKQYILEYTVFGVDECLKENYERIVVDEHNLKEDKILVGSPKYFSMLQSCFAQIAAQKCQGDECIVRKSMSKRLENIRYVDNILDRHPNQSSISTLKPLIKSN